MLVQLDPVSSSSVEVKAVKPPRLNCAGICLHCGERDCDAPACVAWHDDSCWIVCPDCGGQEWSEAAEPCGCVSGVVEVWSGTLIDEWEPAA